MPNSTPGPWGIEQTNDTLWVGPMRPDWEKVDDVVVALNLDRELTATARLRQHSNARLIASAPDLLEALQKVLPRLSHKFECWSCRPIEEWEEHGSASFENCECEIKTARAAIAKALGEQA